MAMMKMEAFNQDADVRSTSETVSQIHNAEQCGGDADMALRRRAGTGSVDEVNGEGRPARYKRLQRKSCQVMSNSQELFPQKASQILQPRSRSFNSLC